jgi:hypothetical protein
MPFSVAVLFGDDVEALAAALLEAPDTRFHKPIATFRLGDNYYGSLEQDLFVCPNSGMDAAYWVLWVSASPDQEQDDRARLAPLCVLPRQALPDEDEAGDARDAMAAHLLVYGYCRMALTSWSETYLDDLDLSGCTQAIREVVAAAREGQPCPRRAKHSPAS